MILGFFFKFINLIFLFRRITFSNYDERHLAAERMRADAERIEKLFKPLFNDAHPVIINFIIQIIYLIFFL